MFPCPRAAALWLGIVVCMATSGCDKLVDGSHAAASATNQAYNDAASVWSDAFTYHPPAKEQLPQTRYCYNMMMDIVCYDSPQPSLTAKLVGYQDGTHLSWVQPGGGSLGASGGEPIALQPPSKSSAVATNVIAVRTPLDSTPLPSGNSRSGEIQTVDLPAK